MILKDTKALYIDSDDGQDLKTYYSKDDRGRRLTVVETGKLEVWSYPERGNQRNWVITLQSLGADTGKAEAPDWVWRHFKAIRKVAL